MLQNECIPALPALSQLTPSTGGQDGEGGRVEIAGGEGGGDGDRGGDVQIWCEMNASKVHDSSSTAVAVVVEQ